MSWRAVYLLLATMTAAPLLWPTAAAAQIQKTNAGPGGQSLPPGFHWQQAGYGKAARWHDAYCAKD
jgi:hypothetical protein